MRKLRRVLRRLIPFRGYFAWEVQVGPLVVQWRLFPTPYVGKFSDPYWR